MEKSSGVGSFTRRVVLLKDSDCDKHDGKIFMPTTIDMAKIKKPHTGQYNKEVLFSKSMSEEVVRQTLQKAFPSFNFKLEGNDKQVFIIVLFYLLIVNSIVILAGPTLITEFNYDWF